MLLVNALGVEIQHQQPTCTERGCSGETMPADRYGGAAENRGIGDGARRVRVERLRCLA
jgi:hypothetical protein